MHISWLKLTFRFMDSRFNNLVEYIQKNEKWILKEEKKLEEKINEWETLYPDSADSGFDSYDFYEEEIQKISKDFKITYYNSMLMIAYSYFEVIMKNICLETEKYIDSKIGLEDLKGNNYIEKSKRYLEKVVEIDTSDLDSKWRKIRNYQQIRNIIAHSNGRLKEGQIENIKRIVRENKNIVLNTNIQPELKIENSRFIIDFCKISNSYIETVKSRILEKLSTFIAKE